MMMMMVDPVVAAVVFCLLLSLLSLLPTSEAWVPSAPASLIVVRVVDNKRRISSSSLFAAGSNNQEEEEEGEGQQLRTTPCEEERPYYPKAREIDEALLNVAGDLTGGRPGAIIETEEQLNVKSDILNEIETGTRQYPEWINDYGESIEDEEAEYDIDDPNAIDAAELGTWSIQDIRSKFDYEWDPTTQKSPTDDPNIQELNKPGIRYVEETEKDDDGVELGYDPIFGPSSPIDKRTILGSKDSYMIDDTTRDDKMLKPQFPNPNDPEIELNHEVVNFRKSLDIIETYVDPFLPDTMEIPRHVAKWHGYPEQTHFKPQNYTNNRFTTNPTDFDSMTPYQARQRAVELARARNAEWLPNGVSQQYHKNQRQIYDDYQTLVGTFQKGKIYDHDIMDTISPALQVLGSCVELLSITEPGVFRFKYHGLMKNKHGMKAWTEQMLKDCGADVTGVVFETGMRKRDPAYDGGDVWNGPMFN